MEGVRISEGPLWEVPLYITIAVVAKLHCMYIQLNNRAIQCHNIGIYMYMYPV